MQFLYLTLLLLSIGGLTMLDRQYRLVYWLDKRRALITIFLSIAFFIIWDFIGIALNIFFHGNSQYALPIRIAPEFPIEELFFLYLLVYVSLLVWRYMEER